MLVTTRTQRALLSFAWCLAALPLGCADAASDQELALAKQPIVGGEVSAPHAWPAVVSLAGCSGTLIHPRLVLYAAHCGTAIPHVRFGSDAEQPERVVQTETCRTYPNATLGDGSDLAYCLLAEPVRGVEPVRVLAGCEQAQLERGREVTLVGFGVDSDAGEYGTQRSARATLSEVADELFTAAADADTCKGDSGGPMLLQLGGEPAQLRLVGVTSAGSSRHCGQGEAHYVNVARKLSWLEQSSDLDLTPCFDEHGWAPTPECGASTCGSAWQDPEDSTPPVLDVLAPNGFVHTALQPGEPYFETPLELAATDAESGVRAVTITLRGADGTTLLERIDEVAPYGLPSLRLPAGSYELSTRAENFVGLTAQTSIELQIDAPPAEQEPSGCSFSRQRSAGSVALVGVLGALLAFRAAPRIAFRRWRSGSK